MTKNQKIVVGIAAVVAVAGVIYLMKNKGGGSKSQIISDIITLGGLSSVSATDLNKMNTYDFGYLKAWVDALKQNMQTFVYQGKSFLTKGGTAVK